MTLQVQSDVLLITNAPSYLIVRMIFYAAPSTTSSPTSPPTATSSKGGSIGDGAISGISVATFLVGIAIGVILTALICKFWPDNAVHDVNG